MDTDALRLKALAESACSLTENLTAGLLLRPLPVAGQIPVSADSLTRELAALLAEAVPALEEAVTDLAEADIEDVEEAMDDVAAPALDCVEMARRIWEAPLSVEAEGVRPLLAALAERPVVELLGLLYPAMRAALDPWAVLDDPERPVLGMDIRVDLADLLGALASWRRTYPGVLPEDVLLPEDF